MKIRKISPLDNESDDEKLNREWLEEHDDDHPEAHTHWAKYDEYALFRMDEKVKFIVEKWTSSDDKARDLEWDLRALLSVSNARHRRLTRIEAIGMNIKMLNELLEKKR